MSSCVIESDKLFLRCQDIQVIEVYEIDSLYITPLLQKHWTLVATVHVGDGQEFEALQIGYRDVIRGRDLERLMQDLMSLGMMVNREGLCLLRIPECNVSDECQIEYYRMFDLFDWSKYHVKSRLNTRWIRNDIANGRPILDYCVEILSEKEVELKEMIHQHSEQLDELNRGHCQEIKRLKRKRSRVLAAIKRIIGEVEELKHNHTEEIAALERRMEEMEHKHCDDIEELKRNHTEELAEFERINEEMEQKRCEDIEELKRKHTEELAVCECEQQNLKSNEVREEDAAIKYLEDKLKLYLS